MTRSVRSCWTAPPGTPEANAVAVAHRAWIVALFWAKVNKAGPVHPTLGTPCWLWMASVGRNGYGQASGRKRNFGTNLAHRVAFELTRGAIPDGLYLDHLCRVRRCVNPDHLEPVTQSVNLLRGFSWQRAKTHCPQGHPYSGGNLIAIKGGRHRQCRECSRGAWRKYGRKRTAQLLGARSSKEDPAVTGNAGSPRTGPTSPT